MAGCPVSAVLLVYRWCPLRLVLHTVYAAVDSWATPNPFSFRRCVVTGAFSMLLLLGSHAIRYRPFPLRFGKLHADPCFASNCSTMISPI